MAKVIYVAAVLPAEEKARLMERFPPVHGRQFGHHCTLAFRPSTDHPVLGQLGKELEVRVRGYAQDARGQAVLVSGVPSDNLAPHITISCAGDTQPVYSNQLLAEAREAGTLEVAEHVVRARVGAFMDNGKWAYSPAELEAS